MVRFRLSGLNSWHDCQRRVSAKCFENEISGLKETLRPTINHIGSAVGTACHTGAETLLRAKLEGDTITVSQAEEIAINDFENIISDGEYSLDDATRDLNEARKQVAQITRIYNAYILPHQQPLRLEERFNVVRGDVEFSGQIDLQTEDFCLWDLKTSKFLGSFFAQMGGYSIAMQANNIPTGEFCSVAHIPRLKEKKTPYAHIIPYRTVDCEAVAERYMMQIQRLFGGFIERENPEIFNANPSSVLCSEKYCCAYGTDFCSVSKLKPKVKKLL